MKDFFTGNGVKIEYDYHQYPTYTSMYRGVGRMNILKIINDHLKYTAKCNAYQNWLNEQKKKRE